MDDWCNNLIKAPSDSISRVINDPDDELDGCVVFDPPTEVDPPADLGSRVSESDKILKGILPNIPHDNLRVSNPLVLESGLDSQDLPQVLDSCQSIDDPHPSPPMERRTRAGRRKAPAKFQEVDLDISQDISSGDDSVKNPEYKPGDSSSGSRYAGHSSPPHTPDPPIQPSTTSNSPPSPLPPNESMITDTIYKHIAWDNVKPDWLVKKFQQKTKYRAKIVLDNHLVQLEKKYRLAVYQHYKDGWIAQRRAVFALLFHELDYIGTTTKQKAYYHRFCREGCEFYRHTVINRLDPNTFVKTTTKDYHNKSKPWEGGMLAGLDTEEPLCFKHLCGVFHTLAKRDLMSRCRTHPTQNANESLHSRIFNIIHKMKYHGEPRFKFGCQQVLLNHNFGLFNSSFLHCIGMMGESAKKDLAVLDTDSKRQSMRVWADPKQRASQGHASHRKKLSHRHIRPTAGSVESDPDDPGSPAPVHIPKGRRGKRHQRFTQSGAYGEGD